MYWSHSSSQIVEELQASENFGKKHWVCGSLWRQTWGKHVKAMLRSNGFSLLQDEEHVLQTWETKNFPSLAKLGPAWQFKYGTSVTKLLVILWVFLKVHLFSHSLSFFVNLFLNRSPWVQGLEPDQFVFNKIISICASSKARGSSTIFAGMFSPCCQEGLPGS